MARCNSMAIQAALEAAGAKNCRVDLAMLKEGEFELTARWD
jgi:hypothetical protein